MSLKRFSIFPLIREHYRGYIPPGRRWPSVATLLILAGIPVLSGVGAGLVARGTSALPPMISGLGVLAGGFLTAFVLLTNLRVKLSETGSHRHRVARLMGETAASALYLVGSCLTLLVAILGVLMFRDAAPTPWPWVSGAVNGSVFGFTAHIAMTAVTVLRRLFGVYYELFRSDFGPKLREVRRDSA